MPRPLNMHELTEQHGVRWVSAGQLIEDQTQKLINRRNRADKFSEPQVLDAMMDKFIEKKSR